ncbi:hypothetical protein [Cesiribacter sp. SM1]|uniref:hypothetical protein n=1 Tax=Cesiribacter sp. SM1 TaxID=2861196 RepID=UPI001CD41110|nr:hypothetical protein [Cesiribacter sp. SM1]
MKFLTTTISIILFLGLISSPIILFLRMQKWKGLKYGFLSYMIIALIITAGITWIFAWWAHYSDQLLLSHYGYDFDAMNDTERFSKVADENMDRVKRLEMGYFGIGWPLKAIMTFMIYSPYLLLAYPIGQLIRRKIIKKQHLTTE